MEYNLKGVRFTQDELIELSSPLHIPTPMFGTLPYNYALLKQGVYILAHVFNGNVTALCDVSDDEKRINQIIELLPQEETAPEPDMYEEIFSQRVKEYVKHLLTQDVRPSSLDNALKTEDTPDFSFSTVKEGSKWVTLIKIKDRAFFEETDGEISEVESIHVALNIIRSSYVKGGIFYNQMLEQNPIV